MYKKYQVNILVDEELLVSSYKSNNCLDQDKELPNLEEMIKESFGWMSEDGISLEEIKEEKE